MSRYTGCPLLVWNEIPWLFTDFSLTKIHFPLTMILRFTASSFTACPRFINSDINQTKSSIGYNTRDLNKICSGNFYPFSPESIMEHILAPTNEAD